MSRCSMPAFNSLAGDTTIELAIKWNETGEKEIKKNIYMQQIVTRCRRMEMNLNGAERIFSERIIAIQITRRKMGKGEYQRNKW